MMNDLNATNRFPSDPQDAPAQPALVLLESAAFQQFDEWMDLELARLVERWIHTAAPNANRPQFGRDRFAP